MHIRSWVLMFLSVFLLSACGDFSQTTHTPQTSKDIKNTEDKEEPKIDPDPNPDPEPDPDPDPGPDPDPDPPTGKVEAFIIQGHMGRVAISCDDGVSFNNDTSADASHQCFQGVEHSSGPNCDHNLHSATGIIDDGEGIIATWGWGTPGVARRSSDGVNWTPIYSGTAVAGMAYGNNTLIGADHFTPSSNDLGTSWNSTVDSGLIPWNARHVSFADQDGGVFVLFGASGPTVDTVISDDNGQSWEHPTTLPVNCLGGTMGMAYGNGVIVALGSYGTVCRSSDAGQNWTSLSLRNDENQVRKPIFVNGRFETYSPGMRHSSTDGLTWTDDVVTPNVAFADFARSSPGAYVAVNEGWQQWYGAQRFYRSTDGLNFVELAPENYQGGHPVRNIISAYIDANSPACAAP